MRYLKMDDPEFWENEGVFKAITFAGKIRTTEPAEPVVEDEHASRSSYFVLGDLDDPAAPVATVLRMPPLYALPHHSHPTDIFMLVLRGSLYVPGAKLGPGDGLTAKAHELYGPELAGPEGCVRVEFFATRDGATNVEYVTPDGERRVHDYLRDGQSPWRTGMEDVPALMTELLADLRVT
ncbi:hypothetical protein SAMN05443637_10253 [Pseudonocardia thermophila]|uniref:Cupin domain-containing protein n=1 Tax=Pseudonocardia thermophila TaxID=1848 RepID=A0A1M6P556_PSETH|nr:hypothetical protein [Pseudonocardia thermophila]SHK03068.1 hypothetical protein SAMN05443637_10253 [Pseudonocardia thermophila]